MAPKQPDDNSLSGRCMEHSGIVARWWISSVMGGILLGTVNVMVASLMFSQIPELKNAVNARMTAIEVKQNIMEKDIANIKAQYNFDHKRTVLR